MSWIRQYISVGWFQKLQTLSYNLYRFSGCRCVCGEAVKERGVGSAAVALLSDCL